MDTWLTDDFFSFFKSKIFQLAAVRYAWSPRQRFQLFDFFSFASLSVTLICLFSLLTKRVHCNVNIAVAEWTLSVALLQEFWHYWDVFKVLTEVTRHPEFLLVVDNWKDYKFTDSSDWLKYIVVLILGILL